MKIRFNLLLCLLCIPLISFEAQADRIGNGGDVCEKRFQDIRDDIHDWIMNKGSAGLHLPAEISLSQYDAGMLNGMAKTKFSCVEEKIFVGQAEKTCKNEVDLSEGPMIRCNLSRFTNTSEEDQYMLVHHEFAGIAGFETNADEASDYRISKQITRYLQDQVVKKLSIKIPPTNVCQRSDLARAAIEFQAKKACSLMTDDDLASITYLFVTLGFSSSVDIKSGDFEGLTNLTQLKFEGIDALRLAKDALWPLSNLRMVAVHNGWLRALDQSTFRGLTNLKQISLQSVKLSRNELSKELFKDNVNLEYLNLDDNDLQNLPEGFVENNVRLERFLVGRNKLVDLPQGFFANNPQLLFLNLSDNQFANLPDGLTRGLIHLKYFSAFKNNLVHLRGGYFKDCVKLEGLYLNENLISNVDPDVFSEENFSAKASVDLSQNRLDVQTQIVLVSQLHSRIKL